MDTFTANARAALAQARTAPHGDPLVPRSPARPGWLATLFGPDADTPVNRLRLGVCGKVERDDPSAARFPCPYIAGHAGECAPW
jgi:hypothetical protein